MMAQGGPVFTAADFAVLEIAGFADRMAALRRHLTPKLEAVGQALAPDLAERLHAPFFAHVARHARRRVNPPDDTWVAVSESRRGYKMLPHFAVGLFATHLFLRVGVIYEAQDRTGFAQALAAALPDLPAHLRIVFDHQQPAGVAVPDLRADPTPIAAAVRRRGGEVLLDLALPAERVAGRDLLPLLRPELGPFAEVYARWRSQPAAAGDA